MRKTRTPITSWMRFAVTIQQTGNSRTQQMGWYGQDSSWNTTGKTEKLPGCNDDDDDNKWWPERRGKLPGRCTIIDKESDDSTSLAIVPVIVSANGIEFSTFAFLDQGATLHIVREDVAEKLKCSEKKEKVSFGTFHGIDSEFDSMRISVTI